MRFNITPTSGYDNSYYDIKFMITFDELPSSKFALSFKNKTIDMPLNILATSSGNIESDTRISSEPCHQIVGYFNLFNDDKMNEKLEQFREIELECLFETEELNLKKTITFFNESFSGDREILPFTAKAINPVVDLEQDSALKLEIVADAERNFHMMIEPFMGNLSYDFFIFTKRGSMILEIPIEILYHELNLYKMSHHRFRLSYMKKHGITYSNIVNEKKIPIEKSEITFINNFNLRSQTRFDPIGRIMPYDAFLPSNRYFVPTWKNFSFYSKLNISTTKAYYSKLFKDEILSVQQNKKQEKALSMISERFWRSEEKRPIKQTSSNNPLFYSTMAIAYGQKFSDMTPFGQSLKAKNSQKNMVHSISTKDSNCADCARKKRQRDSQI